MGRQIVKQLNDKYAIWSSSVDDFIVVDADVTDIIEYLVEEKAHQIAASVHKEIDSIDNGKSLYGSFTMLFNDCIESIREIHGDDAESLKHFKM